MIRSFADSGDRKGLQPDFLPETPAIHSIGRIEETDHDYNAGCLEDLRVPPANRLEKLDGDRKGQYSIRINDQYRICFRIEGNNFFDVEIVDYH